MHVKLKKILFIVSIMLVLFILAFYGYKNYFGWSSPPAQEEYLPENFSDSSQSNDSQTQGLINSANAAEAIPTAPVVAPIDIAADTTNTSATADSGNNANSENTEDFAKETVGALPQSFTPAVGNWIIGTDSDNKVLVVDGRKWSRGKASAGLADKARALYGQRYAEFLDNVKAYAYYPFAVAQNIDSFTEGEITMRFKGIAGRIDQGAGILFDLKPNGDYYTIRANPLENNLVLWQFKRGKRSSVSWVRDVPTPTKQWHDLKVTVEGQVVKGYLNGEKFIEHQLDTPVEGKVGVWTKADSVVYFDDYRVVSP
jgi:hypothetical protein